MHLGVDPGLKGAIVALHNDGALAVAWDMPTNAVRGKVAIDEDALVEALKTLEKCGIDSITVEKPFWKPSDRTGEPGKFTISHQAQMKARINSGVIYGMCKMLYPPTTLVEPVVWKRAVGIPVGSTKAKSILMAQSLWPTIASEMRKDGRADAALIAYYGYRHAKYRDMNLEKTR